MITAPIPRDSFLVFSRHRKAAAIAAVLRDFGTPADVVMRLPTERRRQIETIAGVKVSSDTTWGVVSLILSQEQGKPVGPKPAITVADIHAAMQGHAAQHQRQGELPI